MRNELKIKIIVSLISVTDADCFSMAIWLNKIDYEEEPMYAASIAVVVTASWRLGSGKHPLYFSEKSTETGSDDGRRS